MCQFSYATAPVLLSYLALPSGCALGVRPALQEEGELLSPAGEAQRITSSHAGTGTRGQAEAS
jgi:hypothetical protein